MNKLIVRVLVLITAVILVGCASNSRMENLERKVAGISQNLHNNNSVTDGLWDNMQTLSGHIVINKNDIKKLNKERVWARKQMQYLHHRANNAERDLDHVRNQNENVKEFFRSDYRQNLLQSYEKFGTPIVIDYIFADGQHKLNKSMKKKLQNLSKKVKDDKCIILAIIGYADPADKKEDKILLSKKRAKSVSNYLKSINTDLSDIITVTGRGEVHSIQKKHGRSVSIIVREFVSNYH